MLARRKSNPKAHKLCFMQVMGNHSRFVRAVPKSPDDLPTRSSEVLDCFIPEACELAKCATLHQQNRSTVQCDSWHGSRRESAPSIYVGAGFKEVARRTAVHWGQFNTRARRRNAGGCQEGGLKRPAGLVMPVFRPPARARSGGRPFVRPPRPDVSADGRQDGQPQQDVRWRCGHVVPARPLPRVAGLAGLVKLAIAAARGADLALDSGTVRLAESKRCDVELLL